MQCIGILAGLSDFDADGHLISFAAGALVCFHWHFGFYHHPAQACRRIEGAARTDFGISSV